jgi:acyl dehydratase
VPLPSALLGRSTEPITHEVDPRWTMAYAAGIADVAGAYLDTRSTAGVVAHPLFPVCLEWPLVLAAGALVDRDTLSTEERLRSVHATHDLVVHRQIHPSETLTTTATVVSVEARSPGAYEILRLDTLDAEGEPVATSHMGSLFLGVEVDGTPTEPTELPALPATDGQPRLTEVERHIPSNAAHVYTECARIYNPIHTDAAVADAAGLPGIILHGTATLAMAVTEVVRAHGNDPDLVRRVACRFAAMVEIPSLVRVVISASAPVDDEPGTRAVGFEVLNAHGEPAIREGVVVLGVAGS